MITAYIRCSDGPEGEWKFDAFPRLNERVFLRSYGQDFGLYKVVRVEHYPEPVEGPVQYSPGESGPALRLLKLDDTAEA